MTHFVHPRYARVSVDVWDHVPTNRRIRPVSLWGTIASKIAPLFVHPSFIRK